MIMRPYWYSSGNRNGHSSILYSVVDAAVANPDARAMRAIALLPYMVNCGMSEPGDTNYNMMRGVRTNTNYNNDAGRRMQIRVFCVILCLKSMHILRDHIPATIGIQITINAYL